jgi:hypothetical protein
MKWVFDDGGAAEAVGLPKPTKPEDCEQHSKLRPEIGHCVVRAITLASQLPYQKVYRDIAILCFCERPIKYAKLVRMPGKDVWKKGKDHFRPSYSKPNGGIEERTSEPYLFHLGFRKIEAASRRFDDLTKTGRLIVSIRKHWTCVIDGVLHDTHDCTKQHVKHYYVRETAP